LANTTLDYDPESKLLDCVDRGLDVFGKDVKNVIYWRFSTIYNSEKKDIPKKPELFTESLRAFFGERAFSVEEAIVASIISSFHFSQLDYSDSLTRAIHEARRQFP
jgi:hypothetical protein